MYTPLSQPCFVTHPGLAEGWRYLSLMAQGARPLIWAAVALCSFLQVDGREGGWEGMIDFGVEFHNSNTRKLWLLCAHSLTNPLVENSYPTHPISPHPTSTKVAGDALRQVYGRQLIKLVAHIEQGLLVRLAGTERKTRAVDPGQAAEFRLDQLAAALGQLQRRG